MEAHVKKWSVLQIWNALISKFKVTERDITPLKIESDQRLGRSWEHKIWDERMDRCMHIQTDEGHPCSLVV